MVVDDGPKDEQDETRLCIVESGLPPASVVVLANRRTKGAAGALNSGIDEVARRFRGNENVFVAMLDDDDTWEADHLARCEAAATAGGLDMAVAGIVRFDEAHPE